VLPLLNIDEIMKRKMINARLITAIIDPIIDNQFFDDGGNFTADSLSEYDQVKLRNYWKSNQPFSN
jgi:hypothetical protein